MARLRNAHGTSIASSSSALSVLLPLRMPNEVLLNNLAVPPSTLDDSRAGSSSQPHPSKSVAQPVPRAVPTAPAPTPTPPDDDEPAPSPLISRVDIADQEQVATWCQEVKSIIRTEIGPNPIDSIVHIEGDTTLAVAQCLVQLLVHLHTPAKERTPFRAPEGIQVCHVEGVSLESFLYETRIFMV